MAHPNSHAPFPTMTTSRDSPNPLRPYYVPPSIGLPPDPAANTSARGQPSSSGSGFGSSARDIFSELDYGAPFFDKEGPSAGELGKKIMDQAIWKYTSVLLAQPFDVAKTILQVRIAAASEAQASRSRDISRASSRQSHGRYQEYSMSEAETSDEEPSYFTPANPQPRSSRYGSESPTPRHRRRRRQTPSSRSQSGTPVPSAGHSSHKLDLRRSDSILETLAQLWQHSGAVGMWKATNATFIYNVLVKAVESWTRSLLSALLNLPDSSALANGPSEIVAGAIGGLDVADSPSPLISLGVAVAASATAGVLLLPLDIVRTRLILTPITSSPRAILPSLRMLPSLTPPSSLLPVTLLHSSLPTLITSSMPLVLRTYLRIDPVLTPATYSLATFLTSAGELFLKLPLETVLRRGQIQYLKQQHHRSYQAAVHQGFKGDRKIGEPELRTVVDVGPYTGVFGTMWSVAKEEGVREPKVGLTPIKTKQVREQGIQGLWRGWRVGMWGLVGVWGASALGGGSATGGEF
ncbi:hypothetical protein H2203_002107 [Taxawa tesnikishii (nom. ined.)]|nr:hypothetical protein H2203_002107 [Dothideales sp. JES 119]